MKKKILLVAIALMMFMGVVSASSINGDYKGNPIVKVMSNGKQLQSDEVPAMIYDGHTVVPISLLRQIGASVEWNQDTYSVDVKLPQSQPNPAPENVSVNLLKVRYDLINEVGEIGYSIDDAGVSKLTFALKFNANQGTDDKFNKVIIIGKSTGVDRLALIDERQDGNIYNYKTVNISDLDAKIISLEEFRNKIEVQPKIKQQQTVTQPVQQQPQTQPSQPIQSQPNTNDGNVQNGENGKFQFIGVTDFIDASGLLHITGQIKNTTGKNTVGGVEVTVTLFNQNGNVVAVQTGYAKGASTFNNGETAPFDIAFFSFPNSYTRYEVKVKS